MDLQIASSHFVMYIGRKNERRFFASDTQIGHSKVKKLCTEICILVNQSTRQKKSQPKYIPSLVQGGMVSTRGWSWQKSPRDGSLEMRPVLLCQSREGVGTHIGTSTSAICTYVPILLSTSSQLAGNKINAWTESDSRYVPDPSRIF